MEYNFSSYPTFQIEDEEMPEPEEETEEAEESDDSEDEDDEELPTEEDAE